MASRQEAESFITGYQEILSGSRLELIPRPDNRRAMEFFGFTRETVTLELLQLTVENYSEGPLPDRDGRPGDVWIFGYELYGNHMYVKLKIGNKVLATGEAVGIAICLSWHLAEKPLRLPFKEG